MVIEVRSVALVPPLPLPLRLDLVLRDHTKVTSMALADGVVRIDQGPSAGSAETIQQASHGREGCSSEDEVQRGSSNGGQRRPGARQLQPAAAGARQLQPAAACPGVQCLNNADPRNPDVKQKCVEDKSLTLMALPLIQWPEPGPASVGPEVIKAARVQQDEGVVERQPRGAHQPQQCQHSQQPSATMREQCEWEQHQPQEEPKREGLLTAQAKEVQAAAIEENQAAGQEEKEEELRRRIPDVSLEVDDDLPERIGNDVVWEADVGDVQMVSGPLLVAQKGPQETAPSEKRRRMSLLSDTDAGHQEGQERQADVNRGDAVVQPLRLSGLHMTLISSSPSAGEGAGHDAWPPPHGQASLVGDEGGVEDMAGREADQAQPREAKNMQPLDGQKLKLLESVVAKPGSVRVFNSPEFEAVDPLTDMEFKGNESRNISSGSGRGSAAKQSGPMVELPRAKRIRSRCMDFRSCEEAERKSCVESLDQEQQVSPAPMEIAGAKGQQEGA